MRFLIQPLKSCSELAQLQIAKQILISSDSFANTSTNIELNYAFASFLNVKFDLEHFEKQKYFGTRDFLHKEDKFFVSKHLAREILIQENAKDSYALRKFLLRKWKLLDEMVMVFKNKEAIDEDLFLIKNNNINIQFLNRFGEEQKQ